MISERLREGRTTGTHLRWHVTDVHREAADVIDALVAVVEAMGNSDITDQAFNEMRDAALAMARRT